MGSAGPCWAQVSGPGLSEGRGALCTEWGSGREGGLSSWPGSGPQPLAHKVAQLRWDDG